MISIKPELTRILGKFQTDIKNEFKNKYSFLNELLKESDWSFVIKAHAMIEALVTDLIIQHFGKDNLLGFIERIPLSDSQIGKIAILKQLNLLNENHRKFIRSFSELRNKLVHKIENINFTFIDYISNFDKNQKTNWIKTIIWFEGEEKNLKRLQWEELAITKPKDAMLVSLYYIAIECIVESEKAIVGREAEKAILEFYKNNYMEQKQLNANK
jgi:uncharacterized protein YutE (UPF0331/DUF86 family)